MKKCTKSVYEIILPRNKKAVSLRILSLFLIITIFSCQTKTPIKKNERLLCFKAKRIGELGDKNYLKAKPLAKNSRIKSQQIEDLLFVEVWCDHNSCGKYQEAIRINQDSIYLQYCLVSDVVCTSTAISKLPFIIDNPEQKKYHFAFELLP